MRVRTLIILLFLILQATLPAYARATYRTDPTDGRKLAASMYFLGFDQFVSAVLLSGSYNPSLDYSELSLLIDIESPADFTNFTAELFAGDNRPPLLVFHLPPKAKIKQAGSAKAVTVEEVLSPEQLDQLKAAEKISLIVTLHPSNRKQTIVLPPSIRQEWADLFIWSLTGDPPAPRPAPKN